MSLLLIRHGETDLNAARVLQFPDTPLSTHGCLQATRVGRRLADYPVQLIVTSDYTRARMTADLIARHTGARLLETPLLRERNFGELRGKSYESLGDIDVFALDYAPPGGESWPVFHARVDRAWDELLTHSVTVNGDIAVVTHGLVLRSLIERRLDTSTHPITPEFVVANTALTTVDIAAPWRVADLACIAHLDGLAVGGAPA
jgi:probable phosphoglycerate mutase